MPFGAGSGLKLFVDEFLGSREGILPVLDPSGMWSEARSVAFVAQLADCKVKYLEAKVEFGLEMAVVNHSGPHAGTHEGYAVSLLEFNRSMNSGSAYKKKSE